MVKSLDVRVLQLVKLIHMNHTIFLHVVSYGSIGAKNEKALT